MTCEHIFKDIGDIYSRLFNHRAALQGLACNFVKEFEDKRGEKQFISLTRTLDLVSDCRDRSLPWTLENIGPRVEELKESTNKTTDLCDKILQDDKNRKNEFLTTQRQRRHQEWEAFMAGQVTKSAKVDEDFDRQVKALHKHYCDLEEKLKGQTGQKLL